MSAVKNALVTFSTKTVSLLFKNVCKVLGIGCLDLLPNAFWSLDVFQILSTRKRLLQKNIQSHKLQYNSLLELFLDSSENSLKMGRIL